jgi:hypothetical protein
MLNMDFLPIAERAIIVFSAQNETPNWILPEAQKTPQEFPQCCHNVKS